MIPEKIERFIFLPFLEQLISAYSKKDDDEYWEFLESQYPILYHEEGDVGELYLNEAQSFLYRTIVKYKGIDYAYDLDTVKWPNQIYELPTQNWVRAYSEFVDDEAFERYPDPLTLSESILEDTTLVLEEQLPYQYERFFGSPDSVGIAVEIDIYELRKYSYKYREIRKCMEEPEFPLMTEYEKLKKYYNELKEQTEKENASDDLFDD